MKRFFLACFLLIFGFGLAQEESQTFEEANYEHILSFHSDIEIGTDSQVTITEKIKVYAGGNIIKRGIFRSLPRSRNINGKNEKIKYDILSVKRDGSKEEYHTEKTGSDLAIYIGNKDRILDHGIYIYEIKYITSNQIGFFADYDEFYWNVNGTLWDFPVDEVSALVTLPETAQIVQNTCYTGGYGSAESNCTGAKLSSNTIQWQAKNLGQNSGLTIAVGFSKGTLAPPPPPTFLEKYGILLLLLAVAFGLLMHFYSQWQKYGVDPQKPVVYPQFSSPQNFSPASVGYLEEEYYSDKMISAAIVSLATKGFIKIIEDDKRVLGIFGGREYTLEKVKEQDQTLSKEEINLMNNFFSSGNETVSFDGKYNPEIKKAVDDFKVTLMVQHDKFLKEGNNGEKLIAPILIILVLYAAGIYFTYRITDNDVLLTAGIFLGVATFVGAIIISPFYERYLFFKIPLELASIISYL